jgi:hypothetical protein
LLGLAVTYASCSMLAEVRYAGVAKGGKLENVILDLRDAGRLWPLYHKFRSGSALALGGFALGLHNPELDGLAAAEIDTALALDPTSIELLAMALSFGRTDYQARFDRLAHFPLPYYFSQMMAKKKSLKAP